MNKYILITIILLGAGLAAYYFGGSYTGNVVSIPASHMHHMIISSEEQFIREMIPHHQEAVDTSKIMLDSENSKISEIAQRIIHAQEMEVIQMKEWHSNWFPNQNQDPQYMPMMPRLESMHGKERDSAFLQGMVMHHEMAINMAHQLLALQPRNELQKMGEAIIDTQTAEIAEMKSILNSIV